jgi:hypothetical protein
LCETDFGQQFDSLLVCDRDLLALAHLGFLVFVVFVVSGGGAPALEIGSPIIGPTSTGFPILPENLAVSTPAGKQ